MTRSAGIRYIRWGQHLSFRPEESDKKGSYVNHARSLPGRKWDSEKESLELIEARSAGRKRQALRLRKLRSTEEEGGDFFPPSDPLKLIPTSLYSPPSSPK